MGPVVSAARGALRWGAQSLGPGSRAPSASMYRTACMTPSGSRDTGPRRHFIRSSFHSFLLQGRKNNQILFCKTVKITAYGGIYFGIPSLVYPQKHARVVKILQILCNWKGDWNHPDHVSPEQSLRDQAAQSHPHQRGLLVHQSHSAAAGGCSPWPCGGGRERSITSGPLPDPCGFALHKRNLGQLSKEWISPNFLQDTAETTERDKKAREVLHNPLYRTRTPQCEKHLGRSRRWRLLVWVWASASTGT